MAKSGEVGGEQGVSLADVDVELEPIACGREGSGSQAILLQPCVDCRNACRAGGDESLDLVVRAQAQHGGCAKGVKSGTRGAG